MKNVAMLAVFLVLAGCATTQQSTQPAEHARKDLDVKLRVESADGQPKVYVSRQEVEAALGKRLPRKGWIDPAVISTSFARSDNPPDASGKITPVNTATGGLRITKGSEEILVFDGAQSQYKPGYWRITLPPLSVAVVVEVKKK